MTFAATPSQACLEAWLTCENLLLTLAQRNISSSLRTQQVLTECADICLETIQGIKSKMNNIDQLALLCVGICEECAEVCERYRTNVFMSCANACRRCSASLTKIALSAS